MRFRDKAVLVTGGAMGIGAATAQRLAGEGAFVVIADHDEEAAGRIEQAIRERGGQAWAQAVELSDPASIEQMGIGVAARLGALHGLVNNAGIVRGATVAETGDDDWEPQVAVNLHAPALCAKALLPLLKAGPGHVVNVSSEAGFRPRAGCWVYDATKAGLCALTRAMACELAGFGIRVNTVAPGWTVTEMHFLGHPDPAARKAELEGLTSAGGLIPRLARPAEIAAAIAFLLSGDASYITATTLHVDGGRVGH